MWLELWMAFIMKLPMALSHIVGAEREKLSAILSYFLPIILMA
jgi:hypothetical protein